MGGATDAERSVCTRTSRNRTLGTKLIRAITVRGTWSISWLTLAFNLLQGCPYYDEDDRCGPHMVYSKDAHVCLCDAQSVPGAGGCTPCASGRVVMGTKCVCPAGSQENAAGACEVVAGLGDACDAANTCKSTVYNYCAIPSGATSGTCTKTCAKDDDCDNTYTCADWESTPFCKLFMGVGASCTMQGTSDPACSADADLCFMGQCFVRGCAVTSGHATDSCPKDRKCCDLSAIGMPGATACVALTSAVCQ